MSLAAVRDLRELRDPATADELVDFETDVMAGFVVAQRPGRSDTVVMVESEGRPADSS